MLNNDLKNIACCTSTAPAPPAAGAEGAAAEGAAAGDLGSGSVAAAALDGAATSSSPPPAGTSGADDAASSGTASASDAARAGAASTAGAAAPAAVSTEAAVGHSVGSSDAAAAAATPGAAGGGGDGDESIGSAELASMQRLIDSEVEPAERVADSVTRRVAGIMSSGVSSSLAAREGAASGGPDPQNAAVRSVAATARVPARAASLDPGVAAAGDGAEAGASAGWASSSDRQSSWAYMSDYYPSGHDASQRAAAESASPAAGVSSRVTGTGGSGAEEESASQGEELTRVLQPALSRIENMVQELAAASSSSADGLDGSASAAEAAAGEEQGARVLRTDEEADAIMEDVLRDHEELLPRVEAILSEAERRGGAVGVDGAGGRASATDGTPSRAAVQAAGAADTAATNAPARAGSVDELTSRDGRCFHCVRG